MLLTKTKNEILRIMPAVCFSVIMHTVFVFFLFFGLAQNEITPARLGGLNLVWVSLDKNGDGGQVSAADKTAALPSRNKKTRHAKENQPAYQAIPAVYAATNTVSTSSGSADIQNAVHTSGGAFSEGSFTAYPLYRENMPPVYPEIARVRGYEGIVLVSAEILPTGRVEQAKIRKSSGYSILDQSALNAVKKWRFEPARKSGRPFTMWVEVPIKFVLKTDKSSS
jgi:TonB family protein